MKKRIILNGALAVLALILFLYQLLKDKEEVLKLEGETMGTTYHITLLHFKTDNIQYQSLIDKLLLEVNQIMSTYIPNSEISLFNKNPSTGVITVSPAFYEVLEEAWKIARETDGYYDPTVMPLVNLWSFGPKKTSANNVSDSQVAEAKKKVGYQQILLLGEGRVQKTNASVNVDLSSIAKGYGVDSVGGLLESLGVKQYMVEIGGEVRVKGNSPDGQPWHIGVQNPKNLDALYKILEVKDTTVATSGTYLNKTESKGKSISHIINPLTGYPVTHNTVSISVIHPSNMVADGYATAMLSMGSEKGAVVAQKLHQNVLFLDIKDDAIVPLYTGDFKNYLAKLK